MVFTKEEKTEIVKQYAIKEGDTGSPEVQVALLTHRILYMTDHMRANKKDRHSYRGLQMMVARRTRLLKYLKKNDFQGYSRLIKKLKLRR